MYDVAEAIEALGRTIGLEDAELDSNGNMTLTVDGSMPINFARIDETSFELWTALPDLGNASDAGLLANLLASNHLGEGSGAARLALTPDRTRVIFCERVGVGGLDEDALTERLAAFIRYATFWRSQTARDAISSRSRASMPSADDGGFMIRA